MSSRDMADPADAHAGVATVTFTQNQIDSAQTAVGITFPDGAGESLPWKT
jgi:hypothetical protein